MYLYACTPMHAFIYACTPMYSCISACIHACTPMHAYIHVFLRIFMYFCIYLCISAYIYVFLHVYIYVFLHVFLHAYIYIFLHRLFFANISFFRRRVARLVRHARKAGRPLQVRRVGSVPLSTRAIRINMWLIGRPLHIGAGGGRVVDERDRCHQHAGRWVGTSKYARNSNKINTVDERDRCHQHAGGDAHDI